MNLFINYRILAFYAPPAISCPTKHAHCQGPQQQHSGLHPPRPPLPIALQQNSKFKKIQRRVGQFDGLGRKRESSWCLEWGNRDLWVKNARGLPLSRIDQILPQSYLGEEWPESADKGKPEAIDPAAGSWPQEVTVALAKPIIRKIRAGSIEIHFQLIVYINRPAL